MKQRSSLRIDIRNIPIAIMLITVTSKWLFEDILGTSILEAVMLLMGVALLFLNRTAWRLQKMSLWWIVYIASIVINAVAHQAAFGTWGRVFITIFTVFYAFVLNTDKFNAERIVSFIFKIGLFQGIMVFIHFILKGSFNALYFPLLTENSREYAMSYYKNGYYFGILDSPHEVAGLISFAIMLLILKIMLKKSRKPGLYALVIFLLATLLLTQKKGVMFCMAIALIFTVLTLYASRKQWIKIGLLLLGVIIGLVVLVYLVLRFPEVALFKRLNLFVTSLISGDTIGGGRISLYGIAISLWRSNPLLGVGWRQFKGLTTDVFGFRLSHEVNCDYLQWLCEMGTLGFILNMIPIVITFSRTIIICRKMIRKIQDIPTKWVVLFAVCVQFFTLLYAFIEIPFYDIMFFAVYIISCIIINSVYGRMRKGDQVFQLKERRRRLAARVVIKEADVSL